MQPPPTHKGVCTDAGRMGEIGIARHHGELGIRREVALHVSRGNTKLETGRACKNKPGSTYGRM
jgi:hypothetical protein